MKGLVYFLRPARWKYQWRYWRGQTPWDTNITPPEVEAFIEVTSPGRALDLGCGTGTNAITLAKHGWEVTGVDFAPDAIRKARQKSKAAGLRINFHTADVTLLDFLDDHFDYVLDIGCMFTLKPQDRIVYAETLARLCRPGGWYMMYAWQPHLRKGKPRGVSPKDVEALLSRTFDRERVVAGEDKGRPSAWYWYLRR